MNLSVKSDETGRWDITQNFCSIFILLKKYEACLMRLYIDSILGHLFSTYKKVTEKLTFTPWYAHARMRIRG